MYLPLAELMDRGTEFRQPERTNWFAWRTCSDCGKDDWEEAMFHCSIVCVTAVGAADRRVHLATRTAGQTGGLEITPDAGADFPDAPTLR